MLEDREEILVVSRTLGHSPISTKADVSGTSRSRLCRRSAEQMDDILGGKADTA